MGKANKVKPSRGFICVHRSLNTRLLLHRRSELGVQACCSDELWNWNYQLRWCHGLQTI